METKFVSCTSIYYKIDYTAKTDTAPTENKMASSMCASTFNTCNCLYFL